MGMIAALCIVGFKNRNSHAVFQESKCIFLGSFFSSFAFAVLLTFNLLANQYRESLLFIQSTVILIALIVLWGLFYGTRMYALYFLSCNLHVRIVIILLLTRRKWIKYPEKRDELMIPGMTGNRSEARPGPSSRLSPPASGLKIQETNSVTAGMTSDPPSNERQITDFESDAEDDGNDPPPQTTIVVPPPKTGTLGEELNANQEKHESSQMTTTHVDGSVAAEIWDICDELQTVRTSNT